MRRLLEFFAPRRSSTVARERLQILLEYDRSLVDQTDIVAILREEIIRLVARYVQIDTDTIDVRVNRDNHASFLAVGIRIRNAN